MIEHAIQNRPHHGPLVAVADRDDGAESFYRKIGSNSAAISNGLSP